MADKLIGQNYTTPDLVAKVTGKAKYAEDYKVDGMLWTKLLLSPMPHARITRLDLSAALAMPGVKAIVTADDLPEAQGGGVLGEGVQASTQNRFTKASRFWPSRRSMNSRRRKPSRRSSSSTSRCRSWLIRSKVCDRAARTHAPRVTPGS